MQQPRGRDDQRSLPSAEEATDGNDGWAKASVLRVRLRVIQIALPVSIAPVCSHAVITPPTGRLHSEGNAQAPKSTSIVFWTMMRHHSPAARDDRYFRSCYLLTSITGAYQGGARKRT
jgi:hypothetical protein